MKTVVGRLQKDSSLLIKSLTECNAAIVEKGGLPSEDFKGLPEQIRKIEGGGAGAALEEIINQIKLIV